jgi:hypothetical protein
MPLLPSCATRNPTTEKVCLANLPQLILSILYIFYNAMLSTFPAALLFGAGLLVAIIVVGLRAYDGRMRKASTNSWAISAASHTLREDCDSGYLLPVKWGVVEIKDDVGRCTFTTAPSHETKLPEAGRKYR